MPKWIIMWDASYGQDHQIVEADTEEAATELAYEAWEETAKSQADYAAEPYTKERAIELSLEEEG